LSSKGLKVDNRYF